jgi:hypothetical protein
MRSLAFAAAFTAVTGLVAGAHDATAQAVPGFVEDFASGIGGFSGGSLTISYTNPGTGGVNGAGDGYLQLANSVSFHFGTKSTTDSYRGDYLEAGITQIRVSLNDVGTDQGLEIHVSVVSGSTVWQYNQGFAPPENAWAEFTVALQDSAAFTRVRGADGFAATLQNVGLILIRHDQAPYIGEPNNIQADMGIDRLQLVGATPVEPATWGRVKRLLR